MYSLDGVTHVKAAATFTEGVSPSLLSKWRHSDPEGVIQAGLILSGVCSGKSRANQNSINQTQIAQWKWSISWGYGDWQPYHI